MMSTVSFICVELFGTETNYSALHTDTEDEDEDDLSIDSASAASSDEESEPEDTMDVYEEFLYWYKRNWNHYRPRLLGDVQRAAYVVSPHPKVHAHAKANQDPEDRLACERLIVKLCMTDYIEGEEKSEREKARLVNKFLEELTDFQNKSGYFKSMSIWYAAEDTEPHIWHQRYSFLFTEVFGKLAAIVTSKVTGIPNAERWWKEQKRTNDGQRSNLNPEKVKQQAAIAVAHGLEKSAIRNAVKKRTGALLEDKDFECLKIGKTMHCAFSIIIILTSSSNNRYVL